MSMCSGIMLINASVLEQMSHFNDVMTYHLIVMTLETLFVHHPSKGTT